MAILVSRMVALKAPGYPIYKDVSDLKNSKFYLTYRTELTPAIIGEWKSVHIIVVTSDDDIKRTIEELEDFLSA